MDYFNGRPMKVVASESPSYIKVEFGSWTAMVLDNARGEVKARIAKRNGGSYANLNLSFALEYFAALLFTIVGAIATYLIYDTLRAPSTWALSVILLEVAMIWGIVGYSVSITRRKFMEEFNMFIQSLSAKKQ